MIGSLPAWLEKYGHLAWLSAGLSVVVFLGTLIAIPVLVARMPAHYFLQFEPPPDSWRSRHRAVRGMLLVLKNLLGLVLVLAGVVLSVPLVPGQGILTIVIGLSLLDFPGKRRLELRLVRLRTVRRAIDWIRARARRPPLLLPPEEG